MVVTLLKKSLISLLFVLVLEISFLLFLFNLVFNLMDQFLIISFFSLSSKHSGTPRKLFFFDQHTHSLIHPPEGSSSEVCHRAAVG